MSTLNKGRHPVTIWVPDPLLARLDKKIEGLAGQVLGGRVSRQGWLLALLARELDGNLALQENSQGAAPGEAGSAELAPPPAAGPPDGPPARGRLRR